MILVVLDPGISYILQKENGKHESVFIVSETVIEEANFMARFKKVI